MQVKNNYDKDIFNGDIGIVTNVDIINKNIEVSFDGKKILYEYLELDELVLSYAITIHKSQGGEYPIVIIPVVKEHSHMLFRNLLYTGVTRAKAILILIGQKQVLNQAIKDVKPIDRNTWLSHRL